MELIELTLTDCGIDVHESECLCDVVVTEVTPIRYGLHELKHADMVIKYKQLGAPWRPADLEALLEGLDKAREASDLMKRHEVRPGLLSTYTSLVRELIAQGHSMIDIPSIVGLSPCETARALMSGRNTTLTAWSEADWLSFEADIDEGKLGRTRLAQKYELSERCVQEILTLHRRRP